MTTENTQLPSPNYQLLWHATRALAGLDSDHAAEINEIGFNKFDGRFGHRLASVPFEDWTPKMMRAAWMMLKKYHRQLESMNLWPLPEPPAVETVVENPRKVLVTRDGKYFVIQFPYNQTLVAEVKNLPERKFDAVNKWWTVVARAGNIDALWKFINDWDFEVSQNALDRMAELHAEMKVNLDASYAAEAKTDLTIDGLGGTLRPFQIAGVEYALRNQKVIIADQMGLGKTVQALATAAAANAFPMIVVCPASLKLNWLNETRKWLPTKTATVLNGKMITVTELEKADVIILNYDILSKWMPRLAAIHYKMVVLDEAHYVKNYKAQRTENAKLLLTGGKFTDEIKMPGATYRLLLTGTPILSRPQELIAPLGMLGRLNDLGGFWPFAKRYCQAHQTRWGWDMGGADHLDELNTKLRATCYIRREKAEVLKELPAKQRAFISLTLANAKEYALAEADIVNYAAERAINKADFLDEIAILSEDQRKAAIDARADDAATRAENAETLVRIELLKQLAAEGKLDAAIEWITDFLESGEKLVVFATHKHIIRKLAEHFQAPAITGETPVERRQEYVDRFQTDDTCRLIILNIQAGGVGLTLTAASNVAFLELGWTPALHDQAEDRCHRIGQTDAVTAWYLLAQDTIDDEIFKLLESKRKVFEAAVVGDVISADQADQQTILPELITWLKGRQK